ncbi:MAG: ribose-phosphate pyrophosphokinase [Candidatus Euphemobacter frigidus]|nr:ribose-phosphate pyrophosphokinase [Candidatus Euphemobacter frigidus]MDP8275917.1 ribose-phosphate pyrophosphokinase [Candidatus Euphemobacter frigidus]
MINHKLMLFTGNANPELAKKIAHYLKLGLGDAKVARYPEGEVAVEIEEHVRGADVFLIQGTSPPPNENLMELLIMIDALRRASAARIIAVLPFYGYGRQDRKNRPGVPITAKLVANLITSAGADRLLTIDLHAAQIQGFFDIPVDHLYAAPVLIKYLKRVFPLAKRRKMTVVSPDVGGIKIADYFAQDFRCPLAIVDKRRMGDSQTEVRNVIGEVVGRDILIVDDMISTGTSLVTAIQVLHEKGAQEISAVVTHPVLPGRAVETIDGSSLKTLWVSDSIPLGEEARRSPKIKVISLANLLGEAIKRIHADTPVSILFEYSEDPPKPRAGGSLNLG